MRSVNIPFILVSHCTGDTVALRGWLLHHLSLGMDRIILYLVPRLAARPGDPVPELPEALADRVECRALDLDAGSPLKSAMISAMRRDGLPEEAWVMALEPDEYLTLDDAAAGGIAVALPEGCAAWCLPVAATPGEMRTLFRHGCFGAHDGARPIRARAAAAPVWRDAAGGVIDPDAIFWGQAPKASDGGLAADAPARIICLSGAGDPRAAALRARIAALAADPAPISAPISAAPPVPVEAPRPDWYDEIRPGGSATGFYRRLEHQSLVHIHRPSDTLVVTFDNLSAVGDHSPTRAPWGYKFLREAGCAHLGVLAHRKDWYREPGLIAALEALRDEGLFAGYREVIFTGTSMGGFAALAFSSLSPGARVLVFSPQSTLDEAVVPWETRFGMGRMRNWRLPHSDAAFEIEGAAEVIVISDPYFDLDQRHVERLRTPNVTHLKAWFSGHFSPVFLRRAELLKPVMAKMIAGTLTQEAFYRLYRGRRRLPWYKRSLQEALETRGRKALASRVGPAFHRVRGGTGR